MASLLRASVLGPILLASALLSSCDGATHPAGGIPTTLQKVSGDDQDGVVGGPLSDPIIVRVLDGNGAPMSGVRVDFVVTSGGGSVLAGSGLTNESGIAQ